MRHLTLLIFAAIIALVCSAGQYYIPRAYYMIDDEGHASPPVPLRRLRRSLDNQVPYHPYPARGDDESFAEGSYRGPVSFMSVVNA